MSSPACPSRRATRAADHASLKVEQVEEKARGSGLPRGKWPSTWEVAKNGLFGTGKPENTWKNQARYMEN